MRLALVLAIVAVTATADEDALKSVRAFMDRHGADDIRTWLEHQKRSVEIKHSLERDRADAISVLESHAKRMEATIANREEVASAVSAFGSVRMYVGGSDDEAAMELGLPVTAGRLAWASFKAAKTAGTFDALEAEKWLKKQGVRPGRAKSWSAKLGSAARRPAARRVLRDAGGFFLVLALWELWEPGPGDRLREQASVDANNLVRPGGSRSEQAVAAEAASPSFPWKWLFAGVGGCLVLVGFAAAARAPRS